MWFRKKKTIEQPRYYTDPEKTRKDKMVLFKLDDFTTEIVGRYDAENDVFYVQRADGTRYNYSFEVEWSKFLKEE